MNLSIYIAALLAVLKPFHVHVPLSEYLLASNREGEGRAILLSSAK